MTFSDAEMDLKPIIIIIIMQAPAVFSQIN
jgi:hypothetical protein